MQNVLLDSSPLVRVEFHPLVIPSSETPAISRQNSDTIDLSSSLTVGDGHRTMSFSYKKWQPPSFLRIISSANNLSSTPLSKKVSENQTNLSLNETVGQQKSLGAIKFENNFVERHASSFSHHSYGMDSMCAVEKQFSDKDKTALKFLQSNRQTFDLTEDTPHVEIKGSHSLIVNDTQKASTSSFINRTGEELLQKIRDATNTLLGQHNDIEIRRKSVTLTPQGNLKRIT